MRWTRAGVGCLIAATIAAALYGWTIAPGIGAGDSGELVLAARELRAPHPPGYPLWVLLGRLASLAPFGALPLRVNALSALLAATAVGLFYLLASRAGLSRGPRAFATAIFAGSTILWAAAVEAEVYSLAAAAFLGVAWLALRARAAGTRSNRSDALFFFVSGLALLAHQTLLAPVALLAGWVLLRDAAPRRVFAAFAWTALGFTLAAAIPIRVAAHPAAAWRDGASLAGALDDLLRRNYGSLRQNPFGLALAADEAVAMARSLAAAVGVGATLLAASALVFRRRRAKVARIVFLAAASIPASLIVLIGFAPDAEHLAQIAPFLLPMVAAIALLSGHGAEGLLRRVRGLARPVLGAGLGALALAVVVAHFGASDRRGLTLPERYGRDLLAGIPPGATLILDGDNETFLVAYLTRVEGLRPDLTLLHRRGYVFGDPYGLARAPRARWVAIAHEADLKRLNASRAPVYYTTPPEDLERAGVRFVNEGLAYRALGPGAVRPLWRAPSAWPRSTALLSGGPGRYDYVTRKLAITYSDARAQALWREGRFREALPWFEDAARVGFDFTAARLNLSSAAAAAGDPDLALTELLAARGLSPRDPEPAARLAVFLATAGRYRDAAAWFERAYRLGPSRALASDAARAWTLAGEAARAREWTARARDGRSARLASPAGSPDETLGRLG